MADNIVKDYLGHPCKITEAFAQFAYAVEDARKIAAADSRALYRQIGIALVDLRSRMQHLLPAMDAIKTILPNSTDDDEALALLEMMREYTTTVENAASELSGLVLVGLEQAGAIKDVAARGAAA